MGRGLGMEDVTTAGKPAERFHPASISWLSTFLLFFPVHGRTFSPLQQLQGHNIYLKPVRPESKWGHLLIPKGGPQGRGAPLSSRTMDRAALPLPAPSHPRGTSPGSPPRRGRPERWNAQQQSFKKGRGRRRPSSNKIQGSSSDSQDSGRNSYTKRGSGIRLLSWQNEGPTFTKDCWIFWHERTAWTYREEPTVG